MALFLRYAVRSDLGLVRNNNEDSVYAGPRLLAIADGMGGHAAGEVASKIVIGTLEPLDEDRRIDDLMGALRHAVAEANHGIAEAVKQRKELEGMGTTLTALRFVGSQVGLVHVGDSRAYLLRNGLLSQITHDDTYVQYLVDSGKLTPEEAKDHPRKSVILRALLGTDVEPDVSIREARHGDRYLLCSDGLSDVVSADTILDTLNIPDPQESADRLVELALRGGGPDNVTVIVADDQRPRGRSHRRGAGHRRCVRRSVRGGRPRRRQRRRAGRPHVPGQDPGGRGGPDRAPRAAFAETVAGRHRRRRPRHRGVGRHVRLDAEPVLRRTRRHRGRDLPRRQHRVRAVEVLHRLQEHLAAGGRPQPVGTHPGDRRHHHPQRERRREDRAEPARAAAAGLPTATPTPTPPPPSPTPKTTAKTTAKASARSTPRSAARTTARALPVRSTPRPTTPPPTTPAATPTVEPDPTPSTPCRSG